MFQPVGKNMRISQLIAQQIEDKVISGHLNPGDKLPPENDLVEQFQCSRNAVREALRTLEGLGLINIKQGPLGGPFVNEFTPVTISDYLNKALRLGHVSFYHLSQFRLSFEPSMVEIVASKTIKKELLTFLEENIEETKMLYKDNQVTGYKNMDFHVLLAEATENPMFIILLNAIRANLREITPIAKTNKIIRNSTIIYHERIFKAIKDKKPQKAQNEMKKHLVELESVWGKMDRMKD